jgi:hypothetical protein
MGSMLRVNQDSRLLDEREDRNPMTTPSIEILKNSLHRAETPATRKTEAVTNTGKKYIQVSNTETIMS